MPLDMETHTKHTHRYIYICSTCVYSRQLHTHISEVHFSLIKCNFPKMHLFPSESFSWNRDTPPPTHRHTHSVYVHVNTGMVCNLSLSLPALMINCLSNIVFLSLCVCVCLRACVLITQVCMPLFFLVWVHEHLMNVFEKDGQGSCMHARVCVFILATLSLQSRALGAFGGKH